MNDHDIEQRIVRLSRSTRDIMPASGFSDWIMQAVEREGSWQRSMWQVGRVALIAFAVAAAAAAFYSTQAQTRLDANTLTAFDPVELSQ